LRQLEIDYCQILLPDGLADDRPLVVVIGGSSGGLRSIDQAQFYAANGYAAAIIPYFGIEGLPAELKLIPLEYFRDCIDKIMELSELSRRAVFVQGTSKGAEASLLLCANRIVDVDGVILISPSRYAWGASADLEDLIAGKVIEESSWSWQGNPVEFVPFNPKEPIAPTVRELNGTSCLVFRDTWYPKVSGTLGQIVLCNLNTKLLVFSGQADDLWPSYRAGCEIANTLEELGRSDLVKHISFPNVGHQIPFPGKDPALNLSHPQLGYSISYGGDRKGTLEASKVWWEEVQQFISNDT